MLRKIAKNSIAQFAGKGASLALSIASFSLMTHYLGPELYGRYNIVVTVVGMVAIFAELGLGTIAVRELSARRTDASRILPAVVAIRLSLGGIGILASTVMAALLGYDISLIELTAAYATIFIIRGIGSGTFGLLSTANLESHWNAIAETGDALAYLGIVVLGVVTKQHLAWFLCGMLASAAINSTLVFLLTRKLTPRNWRLDLNICLSMLRESIPLAVAGFFGVIYFRIDALMLSKLSGDEAVGIYGAAYKFVDSASVIGTLCANSFFPLLAYYFDRDRTQFSYYYRVALDAIAVTGTSLALTIFVFSDQLVSLLNGAAYTETTGVLRICCAAIALMLVNNIGAHLLFAARQQKQLIWINLIAAIFKVAINFFAIPRFGPAGAAAATALTEAFICIAVFATVLKLQGLPPPIWAMAKLASLAALIIAIIEWAQPAIWQQFVLLAGWAACLLLIGMPKPQAVAVFLTSRNRAP